MNVSFNWHAPRLDGVKKGELEHEIRLRIAQQSEEVGSAEVVVNLHEESEDHDTFLIRGNAVCVAEGREWECVKEIRIDSGFLIEFPHHFWFSTRTL